MLQNLGIDMHGVTLRNRNVAAVIVTADLSAGVESGSRVDVTVSALGDAPSLMGGTLLLTQLPAPTAHSTRPRRAPFRSPVSSRRARARRCPRACRPPAASPTARSSSRRSPAPPDRSALDARTEESGLCDRGSHRRRDQRLFPRAFSASRAAFEVDARTVELFRPRRRLVRPLHGGDRRDCRSSPTWPRASCSIRAPAPLSSDRMCRSRQSPSPTER